jgi:dephospho-CoA kinase
MMVVGITGTNGAGKGAIAEYLQKMGFVHLSVTKYLTEIILSEKGDVNRDTMLATANRLRTAYGNDYLMRQLYKKAQEIGKNCIIESVRNVGEVNYLKTLPNFKLIAVDAKPQTRYKRVMSRKSDKDKVSYEKFLSDEARELDPDPTKTNLLACVKMADVVLSNDGSMEDLHQKIDQILASWRT